MDFQTPDKVCAFMASFIEDGIGTILEPTPGEGNLVNALKEKGEVIAPSDFFTWWMKGQKVDAVVMNPPFTPMTLGYDILHRCMRISNIVIALMPWLVLINSEKRIVEILQFGLKKVIHLPRNIFPGSRVQCCILILEKDYEGDTIFSFYKQ